MALVLPARKLQETVHAPAGVAVVLHAADLDPLPRAVPVWLPFANILLLHQGGLAVDQETVWPLYTNMHLLITGQARGDVFP